MPYFIESDNPDCAGWATVKDDGEVMGCHQTKQDAIDQMVALSIAEDVEPGGERSEARELPDNYRPALSDDVPEGRACGNCVHYNENDVQGDMAWCDLWDEYVRGDYYCNRWMTEEARAQPGSLDVGDFASWNSAGGRARGRITRISTEDSIDVPGSDFIIDASEDDPAALLRVYRPRDDGWVETDVFAGHRFSALTKIDPLPEPTSETSRQVDTDPPDYIRSAAARGLELRAEGFGGDGLTDKTIREARDMANGEISEDKIVRANAWAARHDIDLDAPSNSDTDADGWPGAGAVAHYLWGINPLNPEPARSWFARKAEQIKAERGQNMSIAETVAQPQTRERDNLVRHLEFRVAKSEDDLTMDGYGAVFNQWTEIEDYMGTYRERIAPGAFKRTIGMRMPVLQFDHGTHPLIGSIPLGRITSISEDDHGLRVKARLSDNWLVQPVRDAIRDGGITGMSFRFRVVDEDWSRSRDDGMEERTIREIELYEVGPVVFPAYEQTSVGVRSRQTLDALKDPEVRDEIARILATGTDIESLAAIDDPDEVHSSDDTTPDEVHVTSRSRSQRLARLRLAGIDSKE